MTKRSILAAAGAWLCAGVLLAGCGWSYSPPVKGDMDLAPYTLSSAQAVAPPNTAARTPATSGTFTGNLATDYTGLAQAMQGPMHDYAAADYFARKSMKAASGVVVPPEDNNNWLVPLEAPDHFRSMLADARTRLVGVLDAGASQRLPALAARAQVSYDCWVERMEQDWWHESNGRCHQDFEAAMAELQGQPQPAAAAQPAPPAAGHRYNVYFEFDKAGLTPEGKQIVDEIAAAARADGSVKVLLVGKADLVGTDAYNMGLSHHRADTVRAALMTDGIAANRIEERWVGLRQPPVPTPVGVREPRNRVVEVNLQ